MYPPSVDCTLTPSSMAGPFPPPVGVADVDQRLHGADGVQELRAERTIATTGSLGPLEEQAPGSSANAQTATRKAFAIGPMLLALTMSIATSTQAPLSKKRRIADHD